MLAWDVAENSTDAVIEEQNPSVAVPRRTGRDHPLSERLMTTSDRAVLRDPVTRRGGLPITQRREY